MKRKLWSDKEVSILKEQYPVIGIKGVAELLPGRSENSVRTKAQELRVQTSREARAHLAIEAAKRANEEIRQRKLLEELKAASFPEYEQACSIFQVGFRVARDIGVIHEFA